MKKKIKVAVDASAVIDLFTLIHPKNDIDGKVMTALQQGTLDARDWEGVDKKDTPKILQDFMLGYVKDNRYYNLENIYAFLQLILQGKIEICITPTTFQELIGLNSKELDFLEQHITTLTIGSKDADKVYGMIFDLVLDYMKSDKAIDSSTKTASLNIHKAYVIAEASFAGLPLVTGDRSLIHCTSKHEYEMSKLIRQANRNFAEKDLAVKTMVGTLMTTSTVTISTLIKNIRENKFYLYPDRDSLRIEENQITL